MGRNQKRGSQRKQGAAAFKAGLKAAKEGKSRDSNPHRRGTHNWAHWRRGWETA